MSKYMYSINKPPERMPCCEIAMDMQLAVTKKENICHSFEKYSQDVEIFVDELQKGDLSNIILTGFLQKHIDLILPYIKDKVKALYLFKCPRLESLDFIAECKNLEYIEIYWNQKMTTLWKLKENARLHTLIITSCNKLSDFSELQGSEISRLEIWGCNYLSSFTPKIKIDDLSIFQAMPKLEELKLAIVRNEDREKDFRDLSMLTGLKKFYIPESYFTKEQITKLKEKWEWE